MIFLDTCILIDYSRGTISLSSEILDRSRINTVVQLEFLSGARDKRELKKINQILKRIQLVELDQGIMDLSTQLMNRYTLSHGMSVYDAIIAATCMVYDIPLWTHNKKDFRFLDITLLEKHP